MSQKKQKCGVIGRCFFYLQVLLGGWAFSLFSFWELGVYRRFYFSFTFASLQACILRGSYGIWIPFGQLSAEEHLHSIRTVKIEDVREERLPYPAESFCRHPPPTLSNECRMPPSALCDDSLSHHTFFSI